MSYISIQEVLLPKSNVDYTKWSVIACDQFTSQKEYWEKLEKIVGKEYSSLNLIFPEVYLNKIDNEKKVEDINNSMIQYLNDDIFDSYNNFIYLEREIAPGVIRKGLVIAIDLEAYSYAPNAKCPIRATEKTVKERLPIRIQIRKDAKLELPHICLFMDDVNDDILSSLAKNKDNMKKLYDFNLNMEGGRIQGFLVDDSKGVQQKLDALLNKDLLRQKYGSDEELLFVVGDGNHSLATAKECWELIKKGLTDKEIENHPARYALCELQNIHDEAIKFEPIHRFMEYADYSFINYLKNNLKGDGEIKIYFNRKYETISVPSDPTLAIAKIQKAIDDYMEQDTSVEIDYIHGDEYLIDIVNRKGGVGVFMPRVEKKSLFDYVCHNGVMPRKSFSIGHAESKRYYLEAHKVR